MLFIKPEPPNSFTEAILGERERQERNKYPNQKTVDKCILLINQELLSCIDKREHIRRYFEVRRCQRCNQTEPYIADDWHGLRVIYVPTDAYPDVYYEILGDVLRDRFVEAGWIFGNPQERLRLFTLYTLSFLCGLDLRNGFGEKSE